MVGLVASLRHAKGLLCLHLTSNPGITNQVESYYRERLSVLQDSSVMMHLEFEPEDLDQLTDADLAAMGSVQRSIVEHKLKWRAQWQKEDVCKYQNNKRMKPLLSKQEI